jgi:hypothetical protein
MSYIICRLNLIQTPMINNKEELEARLKKLLSESGIKSDSAEFVEENQTFLILVYYGPRPENLPEYFEGFLVRWGNTRDIM